MKKVYLVHCWDGTSDDGWYPWIEKQLNNDNTKIIRFDLPNTTNPNIDEWVSTLNSKIDYLNKDVYFIGHSIGCQTIMRYLETKEVCKVGGMLFVAPWLDLLPEAIADEESFNTAQPWLKIPIDFDKIKQFTDNITCIFSTNDYFVSLNQENEFKNKLDAKTYLVENKGHISQDDNVFELREILDLSLEMLNNQKD